MSRPMTPEPAAGRIGMRLDRRRFLKASGLAAAGTAVAGIPAMAGPFTREDFDRLVPVDKKLHPDWVKSLFARGAPASVRWPESRLVGMPVGGVCCGQLYLGGDGRLWHWDIFNRVYNSGTGGPRYAKPLEPDAPFAQGFALRVTGPGGDDVRPLDHTGWRAVDFTGEYPVGRVDYRDDGCPVRVSLEAFSPFIPLDEDDSSLPATFMRFTLRNTGTQPVEAAVAGWMENAVARDTPGDGSEERVNAVVRGDGFTMIEYSARPGPSRAAAPARPDIVFDDFERATHEGWTVEGDAFGSGPVSQEQVPDYQGKLGMHGTRAVNSHATAPGENVGGKDGAKGTLTSRTFTIERSHIRFLVGGGAHKDATCVELLVDGTPVLSATGRSANEMAPATWDVRRWAGREARLRIADRQAGGWGNIGVDHIVFTDAPAEPAPPLERRPDFGTMGLALLGAAGRACADLPADAAPKDVWTATPNDGPVASSDPARRAGALVRTVPLPPGGTAEVAFVVAWHFPNIRLAKLEANGGRHYGARFADARAVVAHAAAKADRLTAQTRLWRDTWYDSTLPRWLLDRTFATVSHLATNTCYRFANGRFYGWEGVGCCAGTCTHVWHYAQAVGRLFPALERSAREMADCGAGFEESTGRIRFRAEHNNHWAVDGQAGSILRMWREHQMSADDAFLRRVWPRTRKAVEFLLAQDPDADGILEGQQHNTLDADWYGAVAWLSGLHVAALLAAAEMARETGDADFAAQCVAIAARGRANLAERLFDGEYFINRPDPKRADTINSGTGCHIDQVFGQGWAWQVGLDRVIPQAECVSALRALWRYNFSPDVGVYRNANPPGRWYAMPGEAGLLMCTFPRSDWDFERAKGGAARSPGFAGYFNECMTGFEYQAASHMVAEGLLTEGLAVTRAVHDRYAPQRRNPYNEIECGDHYARAMAGYGVFLSACGFEAHGPKGHLGFAPRLTPDDFRCAFTAAGAWGSFAQSRRDGRLRASVGVKWGTLRLRTLALASPAVPASLRVTTPGGEVAVTVAGKDGRLLLTFAADVILGAGETLAVDGQA
ncbi:MAG: twin-arginine translocation signal domain-containing protein [Lentisphaerae bacterium]|nr:twin-arginine translocation signal domain-containing protein [Lentisphaerota bacterium]